MSASNERAEGIFLAALKEPLPDRDAFVARECADDASLQDEVSSLLRWHAEADDVLETLPNGALEPVARFGRQTSIAPEASLGHYVIEAELGRGGMGVVYRALDTRLDRVIALKTLPADLLDDARRLELFRHEARLTAALDHPNIATIHSLEVCGDVELLTLELIDGDTLAERIQHGPLSVADALDVGRQLAAALEGAHAAGVVHRDLKPVNIKITPRGVVKVLDFGIAAGTTNRRSETSAGASARSGTPGYMSPEQAGDGSVHSSVDLWALGCILFECFTGERAFAPDADRGQAPDLSVLPELPAQIRAVLEQCLEPLPEKRTVAALDVRRVLESEIASRAVPQRASNAAPETAGNLHQPLTNCVGRERELAELRRRLTDNALVTVTGVGGAGKTRTAIEVARGLADQFTDGVWFVDLAPLDDPAAIAGMLAALFEVRESASSPTTDLLSQMLCSKSMLLILDNCEHLVSAVAELATALTATCPDLVLLATSRESLGVAGESVLELSQLETPTELLPVAQLLRCGAVALFCERANELGGFELTTKNSAQVVQLCQMLDGIPLALELAAARTQVLSIAELNERLATGLQILRRTRGQGSARQQTIEGAIGWSYDLLAEAEKRLLRRVSILRGAWQLTTAEEVCADELLPSWTILDCSEQLLAKSLVARLPASAGESEVARFRLLEPVRQYAFARLEESGEATQQRATHSRCFVARAVELGKHFFGLRRTKTLDQFASDYDNYRSALETCLATDETVAGLSLAAALGGYWVPRGRWGEGRRLCRELLARECPSEALESRAHVLKTAGNLAYWQGDYDESTRLQQQGVEIFRGLGLSKDVAGLTSNLGLVAWRTGEYAQARKLYEESLRLRRELGDDAGVASSLNNLGALAKNEEDFDRSLEAFREAIAIRRRIDDRRGVGQSLGNLGGLLGNMGELEESRQCFLESLAIAKEQGEASSMSAAYSDLGDLARLKKEWDEAARQHAKGLEMRARLGDQPGISLSLVALADIADSTNQQEVGASFLGAAEAIDEATESKLPPPRQRELERLRAQLQRSLGELEFNSAYDKGRALPRQEMLERALRFAGHDGATPTPE